MIVRPKFIANKKPKPSFRPDIICKSIKDVQYDYLKKHGITTCFIDLDGTVVSRGTFQVDKDIAKTLLGSGLKIHIATNRPKSRSLKNLKQDLHANTVIHPHGIFGKPSKRYYTNALKDLNLKPHEVVMIGDRYIQDMYGANRAGIYSILVHKLGACKGRSDIYFSFLEKMFTHFISRKYKSLK